VSVASAPLARRIAGLDAETAFAVGASALKQVPGVSCFTPVATFYLYPNVSGLMERKGITTHDELRRAALEQTGVSFCTRLHFDRALPGEKEAYVRFAYSGITVPRIEKGLGRLKAWAES
jgi:aspartate/methionine/tyrosine aminotransferase